MEALVVYAILGIVLGSFAVHLQRSRNRAHRGEGARGFSISSHTLLSDAGWKVFVSIRNIDETPLDINYFVTVRHGNHVFDPGSRSRKSHRLNPGVRVVDEWDFPDIPDTSDIDRVSTYAMRWDRSRRLISRTDFST